LTNIQAELPSDHFAQGASDLPVSWHGGLPAICRVAIDVVAPAVPVQQATGSLELPDELLALHNCPPRIINPATAELAVNIAITEQMK